MTERDKSSAPGKPFVPDRPIPSGTMSGNDPVGQPGGKAGNRPDEKPGNQQGNQQGNQPGDLTGNASANKHDPDPRKITYRVGWKSGTIHMQDKGKATRPAPSGGTLSDFAPGVPLKPAPQGATPSSTASTESEPLPRFARLLLREAPLPTAGAWAYIVSVVPVAAFVALVWLAYRLSST